MDDFHKFEDGNVIFFWDRSRYLKTSTEILCRYCGIDFGESSKRFEEFLTVLIARFLKNFL